MNEPTLNVLPLGHLDCQYFRIVADATRAECTAPRSAPC